MKKFGGLVLIVIGFCSLFFHPLIGVGIMIAGLVTTWSAEGKK